MDWILLIVPGVIWGASFLFIAEGLDAMGPNGVTFTRILVGFLTLALFPGSRRPVSREDWPGTALVGVLWMAFPLSMFPFAEQRVSSALTGMLNGAVPLFTAIVARSLTWSRMRTLLLVAEVLSPSTARGDRFLKRLRYREAGVPLYWLVDGDERSVEIWTPSDEFPLLERERLIWHPAGAPRPFELDLQALFRPV